MRELGAIHTLVIHPGAMHRDDFLCMVVLMALCPGLRTVFRRDPTPEELADVRVVVCDVGGDLNDKLHNYDHHHLPAENVMCAFDLLLAGIHLRAFNAELQPWVATTSLIDTQGPFETSKRLGIDPELFFTLSSPVEAALYAVIEGSERIDSADGLWRVLRAIGDNMVMFSTTLIEKLSVAQDLLVKARVLDAEQNVMAVVVDTTLDAPFTKALAVARKGDPNVAVSISRDDRGPGWSLYRYDDDSRVDFSMLAGHNEIEFAHPGGFIAKTKAMHIEDALTLASRAVVPLLAKKASP